MIIARPLVHSIDDFFSLVLVSYITKDTTIKRTSYYDIEDTGKAQIVGFSDSFPVTEIKLNAELNPKTCFVRIAEFYSVTLPKDSLWKYLSDFTKPFKTPKEYDLSFEELKDIDKTVHVITRIWDLASPNAITKTDLFIKIGIFLDKYGFNLDIGKLRAIEGIVKEAYPVGYKRFINELKEKERQKQKDAEFFRYITR